MSFVSNFVKASKIAPIQSIVDNVTGRSNFTDSRTQGIASGTATSLLGAGGSINNAVGGALKQVDNMISGGDDHYYAQGGSGTNRTSAAGLTAIRHGTSPDKASGGSYSVQVSPQGRINKKTQADSENTDVFPPDIGKYKIQLAFQDYIRPAPFAPTVVKNDYNVFLPVPSSLVEYYEMDWQTQTLGTVGDIADAFSQEGDSVATMASAQTLRVMENVGGMVGEAATVGEQAAGIAPNPNLTVAFKGPKLRTHTMSWTFAPKNSSESETIERIIKNIKRKILPVASRNSGTSILGYPSMVQPVLYPEKSRLYEFKKCVIPNITVNYSPTGVPSFFKGTKNLPTFIQLSIVLQEIEYFVNEDPDFDALTRAKDASSQALSTLGRVAEAGLNEVQNAIGGLFGGGQ